MPQPARRFDAARHEHQGIAFVEIRQIRVRNLF
jgi:hypothetical protein